MEQLWLSPGRLIDAREGRKGQDTMRRIRYNRQDKTYYLNLCDKLRVLRESGLNSMDEQRAFITLSIAAHIQRARVPKSWYRFATA